MFPRFLSMCLPTRLALALLAKTVDKPTLKLLSYIAFIIGIMFLYLFVFKKRINAPEGGGKTWWHNYRILHGLMYLTFAYMAFKGHDDAWKILALDALFGLIIWMNKPIN